MEAASGVPIAKIRLIFRGKSLDDNQTVGPQCQIEHENVIHMVEKTVPTDASGSRSGDANSASTLSASGAPVVGGLPGVSGSPGPQQGPNLVIRSLQFGWDPTAGASPSAVSPSPDGAQPAPTGSPLPNMQAGAPNNPEQNFFHNIMTMATQAASTLLGGAQAGSPQPGGPAQPSNPGAPNATVTNAQGQPQGPGAVPRNIQQIRINIPTLSPIGIAQALLHNLESELVPQIEAMITTLGRDIVEFGPDAANMIPRSYDIRPPTHQAPHMPHAAAGPSSAGSSANSSTSSSPAPADAVTTQSIWQRALKIQGRWFDIINSVEGSNSLFQESEGAAPADLTELPPSRLRSTSTTPSGIPLLDLPLRHPLRHVVEHLSPHIGAQIAQLHGSLFPLLSHHHNTHHHRPPTAPTTEASTTAPAPSTANIEVRSGSNTVSTSSSTSAPQSADHASQSSAPASSSASSSTVVTAPSASSQETNDSDEEYGDAYAQEYDAYNDDDVIRREMEAIGALQAPPNPEDLDVLDAAIDDMLNEAKSPATPATANCTPGSAMTNEQLWASWKETIDRDMETQRSNRSRQGPFSDAYAERSFTPAEQSEDHSRALLSDLLEEAESAVPGATASGLPLSSAPLPSVLLETFNTRLGRYIQSRLQADPDWQELRARGETSRFSNLSRLDS